MASIPPRPHRNAGPPPQKNPLKRLFPFSNFSIRLSSGSTATNPLWSIFVFFSIHQSSLAEPSNLQKGSLLKAANFFLLEMRDLFRRGRSVQEINPFYSGKECLTQCTSRPQGRIFSYLNVPSGEALEGNHPKSRVSGALLREDRRKGF